MSGRRMQKSAKPTPDFRLRLGLFVVVSILVLGAAAWLVSSSNRGSSDAGADTTRVEMSMSGFQPAELHVSAGQVATVRLVNLDGPYHTDGGGVHQFASPALGIDVKVQPRSTATLTIPASSPGTYEFYCDVCCGGKENPSMRGTIVVS